MLSASDEGFGSGAPAGIKPALVYRVSAADALAAMSPIPYYVWFLDTETTGLPPRTRPSPLDTDGWSDCRMVQIAWQLWECHGDFGAGADGMLEKGSIIVDPAGAFAIPEAAARIHGITPERAAAEGVTWESGSVVPAIQRLIGTADLLVAHNTEFDVGVVCSELVRCGRNDLADRFLALPSYCTMKKGTLPRARWPRLRDLYVRLFQREPEGRLHDAQTDVQVCAEIYFALQRLSAAAAAASLPSGAGA